MVAALIYVPSDFSKPRLAPVMRYFEDRPLLMVSQSANDLCLSLLVLAAVQ